MLKVRIGAIHGLLRYPGCIVLFLKRLNYEVCLSYPSKLFPGHMGGRVLQCIPLISNPVQIFA